MIDYLRTHLPSDQATLYKEARTEMLGYPCRTSRNSLVRELKFESFKGKNSERYCQTVFSKQCF